MKSLLLKLTWQQQNAALYTFIFMVIAAIVALLSPKINKWLIAKNIITDKAKLAKKVLLALGLGTFVAYIPAIIAFVSFFLWILFLLIIAFAVIILTSISVLFN